MTVPALDLGELIGEGQTPHTDELVQWWTRPGRVILGENLGDQDTLDDNVWTGARTEGALTILQSCPYDPGSQAYRFHSAINHTTPHASLFARLGNNNPFTNYRQIDMWRYRELVALAVGLADVLHCHVDTFVFGYVNVRWSGQVVIHYHGSVHPDDRGPVGLVDNWRDKNLHAIQIGARLDHGEYGDLAWVPMTVAVRRMAVLRNMYQLDGRPGVDRPFRVAHSPTYRSVKGTDQFIEVCDRLRARGVKIEPVLIEGHEHPEALAHKATCDACFDSFWLGLQGSGLEAGAMGLPVIAGDARTKRLHEAAVGYCPYLFADTARELEQRLVSLIEDDGEYRRAADTIRDYVWQWHSYQRVAAMYLNVLATRGTPELASKVRLAMHTPADGAVVPAMRRDDPYPWLHEPEWPVMRKGVKQPQGEPVVQPGREKIHVIRKPRTYIPAPEPVLVPA